MNNSDDAPRTGLILGVVVASLIGIGAICHAAPVDSGSAPVAAVQQSTLR
jgi:hypothetical protein